MSVQGNLNLSLGISFTTPDTDRSTLVCLISQANHRFGLLYVRNKFSVWCRWETKNIAKKLLEDNKLKNKTSSPQVHANIGPEGNLTYHHLFRKVRDSNPGRKVPLPMTQADTIPLGHREVGMIHGNRASDKNCRIFFKSF